MQTVSAELLFCRLEHHPPTSHEVSMREKMTRSRPSGSLRARHSL